MKRLWVRFSLAFGVLIVLVVVLLALLPPLYARSRLSEGTKKEMKPWVTAAYGRLSTKLKEYYLTHDNWEGVGLLLDGAQAALAREDARIVLSDGSGAVLYDTESRQVHPLDDDEVSRAMVVIVDGRVVGRIVNREPMAGPVEPPPPPPSRDAFFVQLLSRYMLAAAIVGGPSAVLAGVIVSRSLTSPLSRLAEAARSIGRGNRSLRIEPSGSTELVEVADSFNEMVVALERSESLRQNMIADVAHELRTPVSVLQGNLRAILDDVYPMDKTEIAAIYDQTLHLARLIGDLHELTLAEAGQLTLNRQQVDVADLVYGATSAFTPLTEARGLCLEAEVPPNMPQTYGDPQRLTQVLYNLLANALDHTPADGCITVKATYEPGAEDHLPPVRLIVRDSGDGIPPAHLPDVFERFYRVDSNRSRESGGSGLGLAIVRAIVEMHGGQVTATSDGIAGHGSTFTVYLAA